MKYVLIAIALAILSGCAAPPRYQWGGYDELLYQAYKDPAKAEHLKASLETHIAALEQSRQKVAPGLYAELGTLYLQGGDPNRAATLYAREGEMWPESRGLMVALIKNIERRAKPNESAKQ